MEEVKKDLMKNLDIDIKDDMSMVSANHTNEEEDACIAGEGQDVDDEEIDLETILKRYQQQLEESSNWNQTNTSYSGSEIYEWNLDGLTDRQLTILVHRMLKYATICKSVNNTDRTIFKMIIVGFTGQLRGWWDNYITLDAKAAVINAKATAVGVDNLGFALVKNREDAVYTLVLTILEHFSGRFTNQYETIRSLLNGLRCRHLGEFRRYKDFI
ncbi:hypothetical protein H5410_060437 [Solanum commersonii]|uniref:DUF7746 domain-containing protein n=1 Tax=Solanum commersonii TaxID=4109 RepID=A0A9J5W5M3_SOLCO|nr:hypothetical protein H5410_060437 [Solanum commersonii]